MERPSTCMWTTNHFHECRLVIGHLSFLYYKDGCATMAPVKLGKWTKLGVSLSLLGNNIFPFKSILGNIITCSSWCFLCLRLAAVKRELKVKEMHLQDAARRRFLKLQQDQREMELRRLDDEIERKVHFSTHTLSLFTLL